MDHVARYNENLIFPLLTNGMLLDERRIRELCRRNVPTVAISLDGCRKEKVEAFKTGVDFDRVIANIRRLKDVAGRKIRIQTVFIATKDTIDDLLEYVDFCASLGVDEVLVNGFMAFLPGFADDCLYSREGNDEVLGLFHEASRRAGELNLTIGFPSLTVRPTGCGLSSYMCIDETGNVCPCIHLARETPFEFLGESRTTERIVLGDVLEEDPVAIWKKKRYKALRKTLKEGGVPEPCRPCPDAYGVICPTGDPEPRKQEAGGSSRSRRARRSPDR
jgi:MoaA/NifB/PqqE/SkfB family radical SAM enzyme